MRISLLSIIFLISSPIVDAADVEIVAAEFNKKGEHWSAEVTLKHDDKGWDHYADNWRVVDSQGNILGNRVLYHPHVNEQPFTRSLSNITIPKDINRVYIEAHDKVHGWTKKRLKIDLNTAMGGQLKVTQE